MYFENKLSSKAAWDSCKGKKCACHSWIIVLVCLLLDYCADAGPLCNPSEFCKFEPECLPVGDASFLLMPLC